MKTSPFYTCSLGVYVDMVHRLGSELGLGNIAVFVSMQRITRTFRVCKCHLSNNSNAALNHIKLGNPPFCDKLSFLLLTVGQRVADVFLLPSQSTPLYTLVPLDFHLYLMDQLAMMMMSLDFVDNKDAWAERDFVSSLLVQSAKF